MNASILVIDDEESTRRLLGGVLGQASFEVDTASNGMQVLLKARRTAPDLMIIDVNMPKLDGLTASFHLLEPGGPAMDVIVVTGVANDETVERCEAMGMFYACKHAEFWRDLTTALIEIFPAMAEQIVAQTRPVGTAPDPVPSRPPSREPATLLKTPPRIGMSGRPGTIGSPGTSRPPLGVTKPLRMASLVRSRVRNRLQ